MHLLLFSLLYYSALSFFSFFFFNDTATTEIYTLSLHDALPILNSVTRTSVFSRSFSSRRFCSSTSRKLGPSSRSRRDRKSTRLNSSHGYISYAVFCLKKKKKKNKERDIHAHDDISRRSAVSDDD